MKRLKKWQLYTLIGVVAAVVLAAGGFFFFGGGAGGGEPIENATPLVQKPKEGSVASSVLLAGSVAAEREQYVYFDSTKGDLDSILVNVGDQVGEGQALVQYTSVDAQTAYDSAARAVNKIDRQINELNTYGTTVEKTGDAEADNASVATAQRTVDSQLRELQDSRADAVDNLNKAWTALNNTTVLSTGEGTVVEVNHDVSKSTTGTNQTLVHIVSNGNLQVKGELSEFNLSNIKVGQEVSITSKVYPDKTWTGKISFISDYPKDNHGDAAAGGAGGQSGSKYPFIVEITSEIGDLKQGFSVNMEVKNDSKGLLIPVTAILADGEKSYVWTIDDKGIAKKVEVSLGNADAENQEITSGLTKEQRVITNPSADLEEGKEVKSYEELD
ncbi:efflux RND transporter periplasmic adaptor subunit [Streptococcus himalayensis]|nr:efflux RND transporter periplasmic adaptor subunit [Streptococcus himalayensis]